MPIWLVARRCTSLTDDFWTRVGYQHAKMDVVSPSVDPEDGPAPHQTVQRGSNWPQLWIKWRCGFMNQQGWVTVGFIYHQPIIICHESRCSFIYHHYQPSFTSLTIIYHYHPAFLTIIHPGCDGTLQSIVKQSYPGLSASTAVAAPPKQQLHCQAA